MSLLHRLLLFFQLYALDVVICGCCVGGFVVALVEVPHPSIWIYLPFAATVLGVYWLERALEPLGSNIELPHRLRLSKPGITRWLGWVAFSLLAVVALWALLNPAQLQLGWAGVAGFMVILRWGCVEVTLNHSAWARPALLLRSWATAVGYLAGIVAFFAPTLWFSTLPLLFPLGMSVWLSVLLQDLCDADIDSQLGRVNLTASWNARAVIATLFAPGCVVTAGLLVGQGDFHPAHLVLLFTLIVQGSMALPLWRKNASIQIREGIRYAAEWVLCLPLILFLLINTLTNLISS